MARAHRQISSDNLTFSADQQNPGLTSQLQDPNMMGALSSPSPTSRQFPAPPIKTSRVLTPQSPGTGKQFPHPNLPPPSLPPPSHPGRQEMLVAVRPNTLTVPRSAPTPIVRQGGPAGDQFIARGPFPSPSHSPFSPQSPHEHFSTSPAASATPTTSPGVPFQRSPSETPVPEAYPQAPSTPRPQFTTIHQSPTIVQRSQVYAAQQRPPQSQSADPYSQPPGTPRPQFSAPSPRPTPQLVYSVSRSQDIYAAQVATPRSDIYSQPSTPRPQLSIQQRTQESFGQQPSTPRPRMEGEVFGQQSVQPGHEVNRQLRDLLQRQQIKKLEQEQGQTRIWTHEVQPAQDSGHHPAMPQQQQQQAQPAVSQSSIGQQQQPPQQLFDSGTAVSQAQPAVDGTFRQPLPPSLARPQRLPPNSNVVVRSQVAIRHPIQGVDPRMRMLIQQQRLVSIQQPQQQGLPGNIVHRLAGPPRNPLDPYDQIVQQRQHIAFSQGESLSRLNLLLIFTY
ncbi:unnamed protein product [Timema podura]|uniref:Uncharacterized protein n=1 Tax=Timema podura TaxID=61482 RepID=A0ABN7NDX6_TIMPD|nr:unnamed protein product [Timema podura]